MIGNQLHTLSYLKRVTGTRAQAHKVSHVLALAPRDAEIHNYLITEGRHLRPEHVADMRTWRPQDGWAISRTDQAWLDIPTDYVVVHRAEVS